MSELGFTTDAKKELSPEQSRDCRILACLMSFAAVVDEVKSALVSSEDVQDRAAAKLECQIDATLKLFPLGMTREVTAFAKSLGYDVELRLVTPVSERKQ